MNLKTLERPLILLVGINLIPSFTVRPLWFSAFAIVLIGYRLWLEATGGKMPPRPVLWAAQGAATLAVWQHYHSLFGDEAAGSWLTLLTCLKLFELRLKKDFFFTAVLCFLVLMGVILLDQSLWLSLFLALDVLLITGFLYALEEERWDWNEWRRNLKWPVGLFLKAFPLMAIIFVLFPRFSTGFGSGENSEARMGMTDQLRPGSVSNLISSEELIFRATFLKGEVPPRQTLYWRGAVLDHMEGLEWSRSETEIKRSPAGTNDLYEIEIYLEPGSEKYLFALEGTYALNFPSDLNGMRVGLKEGNIFELTQPLQTRERYYIQSGPLNGELSADARERYLQVNQKPSRELQEWLVKFENLPPAEAVQKIGDHFSSAGFTYTLSPPRVNQIEDFLFKTKTGFCEHYAATMASALRYLKIPARVVVGFQGGSLSFLESYITVRAHNAHAWVEYYLADQRRWRRVDPTGTVAPARLTMGETPKPNWLPTGWGAIYEKARSFADEVEASWIGFLMRFDLARQRELLARFGMDSAIFRALPVFLVLAIALFMAILYFFESQGQEQIPPEERLYRDLLKKFKKWKIAKAPSEGPMTFLRHVAKKDADLAERLSPVLADLTAIRYGGETASKARLRSIKKRIGRLAKN